MTLPGQSQAPMDLRGMQASAMHAPACSRGESGKLLLMVTIFAAKTCSAANCANSSKRQEQDSPAGWRWKEEKAR